MKIGTIKHAGVTLAATAALLLTGCQSGSNSGGGGPTATPPSVAPSTAADNGVAALPADQILQRADTAIKGATSYRISGDVKSAGQRATLEFQITGSDLSGSLAMGAAKAELLEVGGQKYVRLNEQFWSMIGDPRKAKELTRSLGGKWAKVPAGDKDLTGLFGAASIAELLDNGGKVTKGQAKEIDGVSAIGLLDNGPGGGTLYVATVGEPYPLRIEADVLTDGDISFTDFGASFPAIKAPADAEVADYGQLTK
jgi:hypothetical protein